ncbi:MAG: penicillin acylase family protein [Saprospiraceae bacterium]|nr:penicillin acylase family protein [Candidatus Parvibacillus calidus]
MKSALLSKYMAKDLAGYDDDFERTAVIATMGKEIFDLMYPNREDSPDPIIPKAFIPPFGKLTIQAVHDSSYFHPPMPDLIEREKPDKANGSNNWALAGSKTMTGRPILCNDPHLKLRLPSIWYEIQITTPSIHAMGVSIPGAPGILIGFNEYVAFGSTNAMRDVMDYYEITFRDKSKSQYL